MEFKTISNVEAKQFFSCKDLYDFLHRAIVNPYFSLTNEYILRGFSLRLFLKSIIAMKSIEQIMYNPLGLSEYVLTKDCIYLIEKEGCVNPIENWENLSDTELKSFAKEQFKELCKCSDIVSFSDNEEENFRLILEKMHELYTYCIWCLDSMKDFWGREIALSDNEAKTFFKIKNQLKDDLDTLNRENDNLLETIECMNDELEKTKKKIAEYENEEDREPIPLFRELRNKQIISEIGTSLTYVIKRQFDVLEVLNQFGVSVAELARTKKLIAKNRMPYNYENLRQYLSGR